MNGDDPRSAVPDVTIVIPTVGRPVVADALASIGAGSRWPASLVIVDQSDGRDVEDLAKGLQGRGMPVDVVRAPRRGVAAARNRGIERVRTRWFVINDDDQRVTSDWLRLMHRRLEAHPRAVITGMVAPEGPSVPSSTRDETPRTFTRPLVHRDPLFAGNMGTTLDVFSRVGPFDESGPLNGAEDNDWGYRALRRGVPIVYAPEVKVEHLDWRDESEIAETLRRYARAQGAFYGKHLVRGDLFIARRAARDLVRGPWLLTRAFVTRSPSLGVLGRAEVGGILPGVIAGVRAHRSHRPSTRSVELP